MSITGLAGLLAIGRTDGNLPLVTQNQIPIRNMVLQYNYVFDRAGGLRAAQQPELAAMGQHDQAAGRRRAGEGHLPSAAHAGQFQPIEAGHANTSPSGTRARCRSTTIAGASSSSRAICSASPRMPAAQARTCRPIPRLPDYQARRAVHGQRPVPAGHQEQGGPDRDLGARECQRHRLHDVQLTETATGRHPQIAIVGQDGNPYPAVHYPVVRQRHAARSFRRRRAMRSR